MHVKLPTNSKPKQDTNVRKLLVVGQAGSSNLFNVIVVN